VHHFRFQHMGNLALIVPNASHRLVVGQNTSFFCVLYRRDPPFLPVGNQKANATKDVGHAKAVQEESPPALIL
jgi:hypothetical protein